ncbi:MAG: response regulator [Pyrinomonadaceae bacterium]
MNLVKELRHKIADPNLTDSERAMLRCQLAKEMERTGNYEAARTALGELWQVIGARPVLDNLDQATAAEVLLRAGVLTGYIGSAKQIAGTQETAKDLISESITLFEALQSAEKVAEAQTDLAYCYWREGAFDEARVLLQEALSRLTDANIEQKAVALLRSAIVERSAKRFNDALRIHIEAAQLFEKSDNHALNGKFHAGFATVLMFLGQVEYRADYIDRALIEYAAASYHFEQAGQMRHLACVENNLGFLFSTVRKFKEAHEHLDFAQILFTGLKDSLHTAQVDETRARVFLAEGRNADAEKLAHAAVRILEKGGEQALLAEAMTTYGTALARTNHHEQARLTLQSAVEIAQNAGDYEGAGQAALTIIEEMGERLEMADLSATYERAAELLANSRHSGMLVRLSQCARRVLFLFGALPVPPSWKGFSFRQAVHHYEARLIERALKDASGAVSKAAQLLGFKHHQNLIVLLNTRHKKLLHARITPRPRRRSIITPDTERNEDSPDIEEDNEAHCVTILHVEDDRMMLHAVRDTLELEGWHVEVCEDGHDALRKIASDARYDLLLFDNELPGVCGLELVRQSRSFPHYRRTPIIMLSASNCESEAYTAGANMFLRKPEDVLIIAETVARLLEGSLDPY